MMSPHMQAAAGLATVKLAQTWSKPNLLYSYTHFYLLYKLIFLIFLTQFVISNKIDNVDNCKKSFTVVTVFFSHFINTNIKDFPRFHRFISKLRTNIFPKDNFLIVIGQKQSKKYIWSQTKIRFSCFYVSWSIKTTGSKNQA